MHRKVDIVDDGKHDTRLKTTTERDFCSSVRFLFMREMKFVGEQKAKYSHPECLH